MPKPTGTYFKVGCRKLNDAERCDFLKYCNTIAHENYNATHACIALADNEEFDDCDILEYDGNGWHHNKKVGLSAEFDWHKLGNKLNGFSPYPIKYVIDNLEDDENWDSDKYVITNHNCHDFVQYVIYLLGFHGGKWNKTWYCYGPE